MTDAVRTAETPLTPAQFGAVAPSGIQWPIESGRDRYRVSELYPTVQGEGALAGTAMTILRLQGCPVGCVFCDTPETWDVVNRSVDHYEADVPVRAPDVIESLLLAHAPSWVLVTGGEPLWHDLDALTAFLTRRGRPRAWSLALETSGVYALTGAWDWVTVSPKPAGRLPICAATVRSADEIKWLVGKEADLEALEQFWAQHFPEHLPAEPSRAATPTMRDLVSTSARVGPVLSVQPISIAPKATKLCVDYVATHPRVRLSVQTHRYVGVA